MSTIAWNYCSVEADVMLKQLQERVYSCSDANESNIIIIIVPCNNMSKVTITIIIIIQWVKKAADIGEFLNLVLMGSVIFDSDVENFLLKLPAYLPAWPASVFLHENPACTLRHVCVGDSSYMVT